MVLLARGCGAALADETGPAAVIDGPTTVAPGDLVILSGERSRASDFAWRLCNTEKSFLAVDGGRRCVFASGSPGKFTFVLAVAAGDRVALAQHTVEITAPEPPPNPNPGPPVPAPGPPEPDLPPGKFNLARLARDWALTTVLLDPAQRKETARSLAASFASMSAAIAAGTVSDPAEILARTLAANQAALGSQRDAWKGWGAKLAQALEAFHAQGTLRSAESYATAWREIAQGLEGVATHGK
jgi:hypothetical protein